MGYINGPVTGTASNAGPLTLAAPRGVAEFVVFFETLSSSANGAVAITCVPEGGTNAQPVSNASAISLAPGDIAPFKIDGLQVDSFIFTPANLTSGKSLTTILQPIAR